VGEEDRKLMFKIQKIISKIIQYLVLLISLVWVYAPIVAEILLFMAAWIVPLAFTSWRLFTFFGDDTWIGAYITLIDEGYTSRVLLLLSFEVILITIGAIIFVWGLIHIVIVQVKKKGLATTGLYHYIRHPQHLGLILISFAYHGLKIEGLCLRTFSLGHYLHWCYSYGQIWKIENYRKNLVKNSMSIGKARVLSS